MCDGRRGLRGTVRVEFHVFSLLGRIARDGGCGAHTRIHVDRCNYTAQEKVLPWLIVVKNHHIPWPGAVILALMPLASLTMADFDTPVSFRILSRHGIIPAYCCV